jgi:hypothetical protein
MRVLSLSCKFLISCLVALTKMITIGIDFPTEMHARGLTNQPGREGGALPASAAPAPALQRAIMNRHQQARRSPGSMVPLKLEPTPLTIPPSIRSPGRYPHCTSPSQASSSSSTSPAYVTQGVMTPPGSDHALDNRPPLMHLGQGVRTTSAPHISPLVTSPGAAPRPSAAQVRPSSFYPSPFQNHIDQLGKLALPLLARVIAPFERALSS